MILMSGSEFLSKSNEGYGKYFKIFLYAPNLITSFFLTISRDSCFFPQNQKEICNDELQPNRSVNTDTM